MHDSRLFSPQNIIYAGDRLEPISVETEPKVYVEKLSENFTNVRDNFYLSDVQRDFFEREAGDKTQLTSLKTKFSIFHMGVKMMSRV